VSDKPSLLTTDEAAALLKVSQKTVLRWISSGRLRACKPGRAYRIHLEDLPVGPGHLDRAVIYLDDNASNPMDPRVRSEVIGSLNLPPANASSTHSNGVAAHRLVENARECVASLVDASPSEVVFTSGATEANNLFLRGFPWSHRRGLVISSTEHSSVVQPAQALADRGVVDLRVAPVDRQGRIDLVALEDLLDDTVALVSIAAANSETGVLADLARVSSLVHAVGAALHSDATQLVGRLPISMRKVGLDAMSVSGHKMNGPQGVGALVVDRRLRRRLDPIMSGGGHEGGLRAGSANVPGIVGLGAAALIAARPADSDRMRALRDQLVRGLTSNGAIVNAAAAERLPNTVNLRFPGASGDIVLARTPQVAASLGSACHAGALEPSPTLVAMGLSRAEASESIRFSVTKFTTSDEIVGAITAIVSTVSEVRRETEEVIQPCG
jgi:cysteine desulfurase